MKVVFFKCSIPITTTQLNVFGDLMSSTETREMFQGEVLDIVGVDAELMVFADGIVWYNPDYSLFNIVGNTRDIKNECC